MSSMSSSNRQFQSFSGNERAQTFDLFVSNLPLSITNDVLLQTFGKFGRIANVVIRDGKRDDCKIGFVKFLSADSLGHALSANVQLNGKKIFCKPSNQRPAAASGASSVHSDESLNGNGNGRSQNAREPVVGMGNKPDIVAFSGSTSNTGVSQNPRPIRENVVLFVTHVESPCVFWAQSPEMADVIQNVERSLASVCPTAPAIRGRPVFHKYYGTLFSLDQLWYRCMVCRHISETQSEVIYVDFGNKEIVKNADVVELPDCLVQLDAHATKYCLYGLTAAEDPDLFDAGVRKLSVLKENLLRADAFESVDGMIPVKLWTQDGVDVIEEMFGSKTCVRVAKPALSGGSSRQSSPGRIKSKLSPRDGCPKQSISQINSVLSAVVNSPPRGSDVRSRKSDGGGGDVGTGTDAAVAVERLTKELRHLTQEKSSLENLVQVLQRENKQQQNDLDSLTKQNQELLDQLNVDKEERKVIELALEKLAENTISKKMMKVFVGIRSLMLLRAQFDSVHGAADAIEEAIAMVTCRSAEVVLEEEEEMLTARIDELRKRFQSLQDRLTVADDGREGINSVDFDQTIADRDAARRELYSSLKLFVDRLSNVDTLSSAEIQIEKILAILKVKYASYFSSPSICNADVNACATEYLAWKKARLEQFEETKSTTDMRCSLVLDSLRTLQDDLSLRAREVDLTEAVIPNLDQLLDDYEVAIGNEIQLTNQDERLDDSEIIRKTLLSVTAILNQRLENARKLCDLKVQFTTECDDLQHWLDRSPDVSVLASTSKNVKSLKSKLRHCVADIEYYEEDGAKDCEEYVQLKTSLDIIREQLQEQMEFEDSQLKYLSELAKKHFPELIVKHPEFKLEKVIKYNGLLKSGLSLDHFSLTPLPGYMKRNVHLSTYCRKKVVVKEYLVPNYADNGLTEFLERIREYSSISSPYLSQLSAVFFGLNDWHAMVLAPHYELSLAQLVEDKANDKLLERSRILGEVLRGLDDLHGARLVHGALHPNNVLIRASDGSAVVADYNFSKSLLQRSETPYISAGGLRFLAPELEQGASAGCPTTAVDMYSFGLLILWLHDSGLSSVPNDLDNLYCSYLDDDTATLVGLLLQPEPTSRPEAGKILAVGYFPLPEKVVVKQEVVEVGEDVVTSGGDAQNEPLQGEDVGVNQEETEQPSEDRTKQDGDCEKVKESNAKNGRDEGYGDKQNDFEGDEIPEEQGKEHEMVDEDKKKEDYETAVVEKLTAAEFNEITDKPVASSSSANDIAESAVSTQNLSPGVVDLSKDEA